jgi:hypothetical protein
MADRPWKRFEREAAALIGARRFWANSGEALDCEGPTALAQCKYVRRMSLAELEGLAEAVERQAEPKFKAGVVIVRRSGRGRKRPTLVVMTASVWRLLHGPADVASGPDGVHPEALGDAEAVTTEARGD